MKRSTFPPHWLIIQSSLSDAIGSSCRSCLINSSSGECDHTKDEERTLTRPWVLDEVVLAVEKCYKISEIYEVYEYQPCHGRVGTLRGIYKHITETERGSWVQSPEDEEWYVETFRQTEGISLDRESTSVTRRNGVRPTCVWNPCE